MILLLPWLVLDRTGSTSSAGIVATASALPLVLSSVLSGTVVDRFGRRFTAVWADIFSAVSVAVIPLIDLLLGLDLLLISLVAGLGAVFDPAGFTGREAMLPEAAKVARLRLDLVNSIHTAVFGAAYLGGPALAGLGIALFGAGTTFLLTAVVFLVSAVTVMAVRLPGAGKPDPERRAASFWTDTRDGLRFVRHSRVIRGLIIVFAVMIVAWMPVDSILLPNLFVERDQPGRLGLVLGAASGGVILGSLLYGWLAPRFSRRSFLIVSLVGIALAVVGIAFLPSFGLLFLASALAGIAYGPVDPITNVTVQERTPAHMRGRVVGLMTAIPFAAAPVGYLAVGVVADAVGMQTAFVVVAVVMVALAVAAPLMPSLRLLDERVEPDHR